MPQLIKNNAVIDDAWVVLSQDQCAECIPSGNVLIPVKVWLDQKDELAARKDIGIWLESNDEPESIGAELNNFSVIAVNFPKFSDGRGYSIARLIRERYQYKGELRAIGDVLRDQLFFMTRCGFNTFQLRQDRSSEDAMLSLQDFSETYQAAADGKPALFHRR